MGMHVISTVQTCRPAQLATEGGGHCYRTPLSPCASRLQTAEYCICHQEYRSWAYVPHAWRHDRPHHISLFCLSEQSSEHSFISKGRGVAFFATLWAELCTRHHMPALVLTPCIRCTQSAGQLTPVQSFFCLAPGARQLSHCLHAWPSFGKLQPMPSQHTFLGCKLVSVVIVHVGAQK